MSAAIVPETADHQGQEAIFLRSALRPESLEGIQLVKSYRGPCLFWDGKELSEWQPQGVTSLEGGLAVWGPALTGFVPWDWTQGDGRKLWETARIFAGFFRALESAGRLPESLHPLQLHLSENGQVLFLHRPLAERLQGVRDAETERLWSCLLHPQARGPAAIAFFLSVLAFRSLTASWPFHGKEAQEISELIRKRVLAPVRMLIPGLDPDLAVLLERGLSGRPWIEDLSHWQTLTARLDRDSAVRSISVRESGRLRVQAEVKGALLGFRHGMETFFRRYRLGLAVGAMAGVFLFFLFGSLLWESGDESGPPLTARQTIETYYRGFTDINDQVSRQVLSPEGKKDPQIRLDLDELSRYFVLVSVRQKYFMSTGFLNAQFWSDEGRPSPDPGTNVYGIVDLFIKELEPGAFEVRYEKWISQEAFREDSSPPERTWQGAIHTDTVSLVKIGGLWKILSITRKTQPLPSP